MREELEEIVVKLSIQPGDVLFVDARAINAVDLARANPPLYKAGTTHVIRGGNRIISVFPEGGQSVKDCLYNMPVKDVQNLLSGVRKTDTED